VVDFQNGLSAQKLVVTPVCRTFVLRAQAAPEFLHGTSTPQFALLTEQSAKSGHEAALKTDDVTPKPFVQKSKILTCAETLAI
jgi:hypothetical protein